RAKARRTGEPIPLAFPSNAPLFNVPLHLNRNLTKDLKAAGIPVRDANGLVVDVHALRHTFGTMLARGGVTPRRAQELMRHSDPRLTSNVYTHLRLHDTRGALDVLPDLPVNRPTPDIQRAVAGGESLAPLLAPTQCKLVQAGSSPVTLASAS